MTIHVAHVITSFDVGGLQNGIVNLINHSDPSRLRHTVVSLRDRTGLAARLKRGEVVVAGIAEGRDALAFRKIARCLRRVAPDVVHTRNWGTYLDGMLAALCAGVPARIHGYHGRDLSNAQRERFRRRVIGRALFGVTDRIITLTPTMRREYVRDFRVSESAISVIPNGVDLSAIDAFDPLESARSSFTVCTVGRLDAVKNLPLLVRAFAAMTERSPSDRLLVVGDGPERRPTQRLAEQLGMAEQVEFLGERKDVPAVMKAADVYVQPSHYEGMSNTIVEAMACGVPVVCTDVGGNADVVGREGDAIIVPSDDAEALARVLGELRAAPAARSELGARGRRRVERLFTLDAMIEGYTQVYERVADANTVAAGSRGG